MRYFYSKEIKYNFCSYTYFQYFFLHERCLNFANMGKERQGPGYSGCNRDLSCLEDHSPHETDNNNLLWVARVLETLVYDATDLMVPRFQSPILDGWSDISKTVIEGSLRERGKSRADLWALAGLTAVELSTQYHNSLCDEDDMTKYCGGNPENTTCEIKLPRPVFKYGRKDCTGGCTGFDSEYDFCSPASETHPDPHGNGTSVTAFFRDNFGLTAEESVALMGAHTLGHANEQVIVDNDKFNHLAMNRYFVKPCSGSF